MVDGLQGQRLIQKLLCQGQQVNELADPDIAY
jgi:hypothetical protein